MTPGIPKIGNETCSQFLLHFQSTSYCNTWIGAGCKTVIRKFALNIRKLYGNFAEVLSSWMQNLIVKVCTLHFHTSNSRLFFVNAVITVNVPSCLLLVLKGSRYPQMSKQNYLLSFLIPILKVVHRMYVFYSWHFNVLLTGVFKTFQQSNFYETLMKLLNFQTFWGESRINPFSLSWLATSYHDEVWPSQVFIISAEESGASGWGSPFPSFYKFY